MAGIYSDCSTHKIIIIVACVNRGTTGVMNSGGQEMGFEEGYSSPLDL